MAGFPSRPLLAAALSTALSCSLAGCADEIGGNEQSARSADLGASDAAKAHEDEDDSSPDPASETGANDDEAGADGGSSSRSAGALDAGTPRIDGGPGRGAYASYGEGGLYVDLCQTIRYRIDVAFSSAASSAHDSCIVDDDCTITVARARCDSTCSSACVSTQGAALIATTVHVIERDLCPMAEQHGCVPPPTACDDDAAVPRCVDGVCQAHAVGCPDHVSELEGQSCSELGKECWDHGWCPLGMVCNDELQPGQLRWEPIILLCSVRTP